MKTKKYGLCYGNDKYQVYTPFDTYQRAFDHFEIYIKHNSINLHPLEYVYIENNETGKIEWLESEG